MGNYDYSALSKSAVLNIAMGESDTQALDREVYQRSGQISIPATWTASNLLVLTSLDGVTYQPLLDGDGCYVVVDCEPSMNCMLPDELQGAGARYIKLRCVSKTDGAVAVLQGAATILNIVLTQ